jgi:hypothetical protein
MSRKMKRKRIETDEPEQEDETETEDIYDDEQREKMLEEDEITAAESAFMEGREMKIRKKRRPEPEHKDTASVELAEEEYTED